MSSINEFWENAVPVYLASEYWYCAAKVFHSVRLGEVQNKRKQIGREMHEAKASQDLESLDWVISPITPENTEHLKSLMSQQVSEALNDKVVLSNSDETTLYYGVISKVKCIGKPDAVECTDGITPTIIERKYTKQVPFEPWLDHRVQVQLYMMTLLELGFSNVKARIEYWDRETNKLSKSFELKPEAELMEKAIHGVEETAKILNGSDDITPTKNSNKCRTCEYRVICKWRADLRSVTPPFFLDIETTLEGTLVWCSGIYDPVRGQFKQVFLDQEEDEASLLKEMLQTLLERPTSRVFTFSGSEFEGRVLYRRLQAHGLDTEITDRIVDVQPRILWKLKMVSTGGLKSLASRHGYYFRHEMDGIEAAFLYQDYQQSKSSSIKNKLLEYNEDDVMAILHLALCEPVVFDYNPPVIDEIDRRLMKNAYEHGYLRIRHRVEKGWDFELRLRAPDNDNSELWSVLEKNGFNPRAGAHKNDSATLYGYSQVSDFLSMIEVSLKEILESRGLKRYK